MFEASTVTRGTCPPLALIHSRKFVPTLPSRQKFSLQGVVKKEQKQPVLFQDPTSDRKWTTLHIACSSEILATLTLCRTTFSCLVLSARPGTQYLPLSTSVMSGRAPRELEWRAMDSSNGKHNMCSMEWAERHCEIAPLAHLFAMLKL